ncbi:glycine cleavage system protein GcvH [Sulfuriroseicoccus oceanibius]|uniref:Glycine cleavage system H protein n=2 Tax=Sulfuriroseicoccus oceanibius TaxID=2707525 RepID=A0A7T7F426_9BACT|nr:glycine cleavage system protein GcvH [Sulfuriroseicoccus oceanibius]
MMNVPDDLKYTESHEWIRIEGDTITVGITDHAQEELTDVVFVEVPDADEALEAGDPAAVVESVKAASDIYAPVDGVIVEGNEGLADEPDLVNTDPYGEGWIYRLKVNDVADLDGMLSADQYRELLG